MSAVDDFANSFKPEARSAGSSLAGKGLVRLSRPSDLEISAYIKASTSIKVSIQTESFESTNLSSQCNCPIGKKGQLCKHIWAVLLQVKESQADFLNGKKEIAASSPQDAGLDLNKSRSKFKPQASTQAAAARPISASQTEFLDQLKKKQGDHRKQQYQKQKQRIKEMKQGKGKEKGKNKTSKLHQVPQLPEEVEKALGYFSENGFPLESSFVIKDIRTAKKKLSQIFHPDVGGSHDEIVTLNDHFEVLIQFLEK